MIKVKGSAYTAARAYAEKHWCRKDGTAYRITLHSAEDGGREWTQLTSYNGYKLLFVRKEETND